jgi:hypothetical protein
MFFPAADTIAFAEGGVEVMRIDSAGKVGINTTPAAGTDAKLQVTGGTTNVTSLATSYSAATIAIVPKSTSGYSLAIASGTGDHPQLQVSAGGAASGDLLLQPYGGNLIVGDTTTGSRLKVKSTGTTNSTISFQVFDSGGTNEFYIQDGGNINTGLKASSPYNQTTGSAANMFVDSNGNLNRSTSSLKYKTDVNDATHGLIDLLKLRSVTYKGKRDGDTIFGGLIAEEVDAAGLSEFVQYSADGSPDALAYGNMVSLCIKAIQEQQALITQLQADVAALKGTP